MNDINTESGCVKCEIKCIKINDYGKGTIVDIQRIKPEKFQLLILGIHFRDKLDVFINRLDDSWQLRSNGKSNDRGQRLIFKNEYALRYFEADALQTLYNQIRTSMYHLLCIELS